VLTKKIVSESHDI